MSVLDYFENTAIRKVLSYCRVEVPVLLDHIERLCAKPNSSEITITFKPKWRESCDDIELKNMIYTYFKHMIGKLSIDDIILVPEYGQNYNLHFHGIITGHAKELSQLKTFLNRRFGRTYIRSIRYVESYKKYIMKEQPTDYTEGFILRLQEADTLIL